MSRRLAASLVIVIALGGLAACSSGSPSTTGAQAGRCANVVNAPDGRAADGGAGSALVPAYGAYLGAYAPQPNGYAGGAASFNDFQRSACHWLGVAHVYWQWNSAFPSAGDRALVAAGHRLLVSWTGTDIAAMADGSQDAGIRKAAEQLASLHAPVYFEFRAEMDRPNLRSVVHSPQDFVRAWLRVRRIFGSVAGVAAQYVWCPTAAGFATGRAQRYYPGDAQVDWVCGDVYPVMVGGRTPYESFGSLVRPMLDWSRRHNKPVMIGEFGVPQSYSAGEQARWLDQVRTLLPQLVQIKSLIYFNGGGAGAGPQQRYRLSTDPAVTAAFQRLAGSVHR